MSRFAIVGLGNFGLELARSLARLGAQVTAIDNDPAHLEKVKDEVHTAIRMDARDRETLEDQGIHEVDCAVVCMGEDFEAAELCAVHLTELGCPRVLVRGTTRERVEILDALGPKVITPGLGEARELAVRLVSPGLREYSSFVGGHQVAEVVVPEVMEGRTLGDLKFLEKGKVHVVALRRGLTTEELIVGPGSQQVLRAGDNLLLLGAEPDLIRAGREF